MPPSPKITPRSLRKRKRDQSSNLSFPSQSAKKRKCQQKVLTLDITFKKFHFDRHSGTLSTRMVYDGKTFDEWKKFVLESAQSNQPSPVFQTLNNGRVHDELLNDIEEHRLKDVISIKHGQHTEVAMSHDQELKHVFEKKPRRLKVTVRLNPEFRRRKAEYEHLYVTRSDTHPTRNGSTPRNRPRVHPHHADDDFTSLFQIMITMPGLLHHVDPEEHMLNPFEDEDDHPVNPIMALLAIFTGVLNGEEQNRGATEETIDKNSAKFILQNLSQIPEDRRECRICLTDFGEGEEIRKLNCNHFYHTECVDGWLKDRDARCPLCRTSVDPGEGESLL